MASGKQRKFHAPLLLLAAHTSKKISIYTIEGCVCVVLYVYTLAYRLGAFYSWLSWPC